MTAALLAKRLRLPDGTAPNVFTCSRLVDSESTADLGAREMKEAGVDAIVIVPDTWFFPGKTAMALTAHFPPTTPLACVGGNNAPKPGVVGIDALVGAYAQTGRLCPMVIGTMPETGLDPEFDAKTKDEIVDLAYAMLTRVALQGKRFVAVDTDSMQMETALNHVHAARRFFGLESTRESMKLFADMLRKKGGYDPEELKALRDWVVNVKFKDRIFTDSEDIARARPGRLHRQGRQGAGPRRGRQGQARRRPGPLPHPPQLHARHQRHRRRLDEPARPGARTGAASRCRRPTSPSRSSTRPRTTRGRRRSSPSPRRTTSRPC